MALAALGLATPALHASAADQAPARNTPVFGSGNGPVDISADEVEVLNTENKAIWRGSVEAIQNQDRLRTPQLTVYFAHANTPAGSAANAAAPAGGGGGGASAGGLGAGFGSIQRMEAEGPVYYVTPTQNARGDHATYDAASNTIVMTGNVVLVQDKNVVQGDKLTIDTQTNHSVLVSNNTSRTEKRVRGVFYQAQNNQPQQGAAAKPAATPASRP